MRPRLLVIEDDQDSLEMLALVLETSGFDVVCAAHSADARAALERDAFDLVLADFMVDNGDPEHGWRGVDDLVRLARPTPIGLLTAWPIAEARRVAHEVAFVLVKPCGSEELLDRLSRALALPPLDANHEQVLRSYFRHLERGDYDGLAAGCTEDIVYHLPSAEPQFARTVTGRHAFRDFTAQTFDRFHEPRFEVHAIRPLPAGALVHYTGSWREPTGTRTSLPGCVLFVLDGAEITQIGVRVDVARLQAS